MCEKKFSVFDIQTLKEAFDSASLSCDEVPKLMYTYIWDYVGKTEDDSLLFGVGDKTGPIEIEFFDFEHPLKRTCSIYYWENGVPTTLSLNRRK